MEQNKSMPKFKERLFMHQGDLKLCEYAAKLGITRQTLGFYINGDRIPDIATLARISKALNVSADYLLGLTDIQTPDSAIRGVCEYTGLSQEAVVLLHHLYAENDLLSALITWEGFDQLIDYVVKYKNLRYVVSEYGVLIEDDYDSNITYSEIYNYLCVQQFSNFLKNYGKLEG